MAGIHSYRWLVVGMLGLGLVRSVQADDTVLVVGKADARDQAVIATAVTSALEQARWTVVDPPFASAEIATIVTCLDSDKPWTCIEPLAKPKRIERIAIVQATSEKVGVDTQIKLVGQLVVAGVDVPPIEQQYCKPCSNTALAASATDLAKRLLDASTTTKTQTTLDIQTVPAGAVVTIDGHMIGESDGHFSVEAGHHKLLLQRSGFRPIIRELDLVDGSSTPIAETLVELGGSHDDGGGPSHLVPGIVIVGGVAALVAGSWISWTAEPGATEQRSQYYYSGPGIALAAAGGVAIGVGVYLWLHESKSVSAPVVSIGPSGAYAGWTSSF